MLYESSSASNQREVDGERCGWGVLFVCSLGYGERGEGNVVATVSWRGLFLFCQPHARWVARRDGVEV